MLQPHEGSSGSSDLQTALLLPALLQPHEGSSGRWCRHGQGRRFERFNPTKVRLEDARGSLDTDHADVLQPPKVRLEGREDSLRAGESSRFNPTKVRLEVSSGIPWTPMMSLQPHEGSSGSVHSWLPSPASSALQPHEGSSGSVAFRSEDASSTQLQPHEGSSGRPTRPGTRPASSSFNPTKVRLEASPRPLPVLRFQLQPHEGSSGSR